MGTEIKTEKSKGGTIRLAEALETPEATFRAAEELAKTVFPREPGVDAIRRLHGLSHQAAIYLEQEIRYAKPAPQMSARELAAWERGQERAQGLEEE